MADDKDKKSGKKTSAEKPSKQKAVETENKSIIIPLDHPFDPNSNSNSKDMILKSISPKLLFEGNIEIKSGEKYNIEFEKGENSLELGRMPEYHLRDKKFEEIYKGFKDGVTSSNIKLSDGNESVSILSHQVAGNIIDAKGGKDRLRIPGDLCELNSNGTYISFKIGDNIIVKGSDNEIYLLGLREIKNKRGDIEPKIVSINRIKGFEEIEDESRKIYKIEDLHKKFDAQKDAKPDIAKYLKASAKEGFQLDPQVLIESAIKNAEKAFDDKISAIKERAEKEPWNFVITRPRETPKPENEKNSEAYLWPNKGSHCPSKP